MSSNALLSAANRSNWQKEGKAHFQTGDAFFRTSSRTGRDLAVLAAIAYKSNHPRLRILDAMTGCGVRPLRYALEAKADYVWANEGNGELRSLIQTNLRAIAPSRYKLTHQDANAVFFDCYARQDFYDLIDIDSFSSPMPVLSTALWAVKIGGLLYLTSTDGRATSGRAPNKSLRSYSAYARAHPAIHEQGLRLLLGTVMQQAAAKGLCAEPVFSLYNGEVNRVMVRITRNSWRTEQYGFLAYCHDCGQFQTVGWKSLGRVSCNCRLASLPIVSGPMWLGALHSDRDLNDMRQLATERAKDSSFFEQSRNAWDNCVKLIDRMRAENNLPPYFYLLGEIGKRGKMDIPPSAVLMSRLRQQGFRATGTHIEPQAIKTDAPFAACLQIAKDIDLEIAHQLAQPPQPPE